MAFSRRNNSLNRWLSGFKGWKVEQKMIAYDNTDGEKVYTHAYNWGPAAGPFLLRRSALRVANRLDRREAKIHGEFNEYRLHRVTNERSMEGNIA